MTDPRNSTDFMKKALSLAEKAFQEDEVPVGALIVQNGKIISETYNQKERTQNPCNHAEILAITQATSILKNWRLSDCELYVTLEPCVMCAGALIQSRISKVYFGAADPKGGALGTLYSLHEDNRLNHRFECEGGILSEDCGKLLSDFFRRKRTKT